MEGRSLAWDGSKAYSTFRFALAGILAVASLAVLVLAGLLLARRRTQHLEEAKANAQNPCLVHGRNVRPASRVSIVDRDYFVRLHDDPDAGLVTSEPVLGRITGKWAIVLARRINRPDGSFQGMVAGTVSLDYLTRLFSDLKLGPEGVVALAGANLWIFARHVGSKGPAIQPGKVNRTISRMASRSGQ